MKLKVLFLAFTAMMVLSIRSLDAQQRVAKETSADNAQNRVIQVRMTNQGFDPNVLRLNAEPGQKITLKIENRSKSEHGLRIKFGGQEYGPQNPVAPGKTVTYQMTMPNEGGLGSFYSPVGDDRTKGFSGHAIVGGEAPGGL